MRDRAEFRATREAVGMTQQALADRLGVRVRSVKRWEAENDEGWYAPPDEAWAVLDGAMAAQRSAVAAAIDKVGELASELGEPSCVTLSYWLSEADYLGHSTDAALGVAGDWRMANANARAAASALTAMGVEVAWVNGAAHAASAPGE